MSTQGQELLQYKVNGVLYKQLYRKCGSKKCKCKKGLGHGPYWYAFDGNGGAPDYFGLELPAQIIEHIKLLKKSMTRIKKVETEVEARRRKHQAEVDRAEREYYALQALRSGEYAAARVLESLGLNNLVIKLDADVTDDDLDNE